jgi:hypothetical protein
MYTFETLGVGLIKYTVNDGKTNRNKYVIINIVVTGMAIYVDI